MIFIYLDGSDRTSDIELGFSGENQLQQRADSCSFLVINGTKPTEHDDIKAFDGAYVASASGADITFTESYETGVQAFREGQILFLRIGESDEEKAVVQSYNESTRTVTLTATPAATISAGDKVGELIFGGTVAKVTDKNIHSLSNLVWQVTGIDYSKIFDKKTVRDTWADVDSRYIINDFVNTTVNLNQVLDTMAYADDAAIQAVYFEGSDGGNPTVNTTDFIESTASAVFSWTFAAGTATFSAAVTSRDISELTGASSGTPTKGNLMLWLKTSDFALISDLKVRVGSDSGNYAEFTVELENTTDWQYVSMRFTDASISGTPDWTAVDYVRFVVTETASGDIQVNGLRVNANGSFTLYNVESTPELDDFRAPQTKPTELINLLAKTWEYFWYIDYERDIHFQDIESTLAPFNVNETDTNFHDLQIDVDVSNLGNRIVISGGESTSTSQYAEVHEGDNAAREWVLKTKFANLEISIDDNTSTDTMESGTNTTTVKATLHGLSVGDHITNRTRNNAVRRVLTVPDVNTFTVLEVASQTNGDTFSKFAIAKTDGIEGIDDESTVDYVTNSNSQSVKATDGEDVLTSGQFIRFAYNERVPIRLQYTENVSAAALRALGIGDGIFDLDTYIDNNIADTSTALAIAQAKVAEFSNAIITGTFQTEQKGLRSGQLISVTDSTRGISDEYLIQKVQFVQDGGTHLDHITFKVTFGTTLYGWIEFMQKLLRTTDSIAINEDEIVDTFATSSEVVDCEDEHTQFVLYSGAWHYEDSTGTGQPLRSRYDLAQYS